MRYAMQEKETLMVSDNHPNIVRLFGMENSDKYHYLALQRCYQTLADLLASRGAPISLVNRSGRLSDLCPQVSKVHHDD
jgi:serine/threonine protein kinase